ncbi:MAG: glycosyltransferase family 39 protein [bacterium]
MRIRVFRPLLFSFVLLCLPQPEASAQTDDSGHFIPNDSGIYAFDSQGRILSTHHTPTPPTDIEILPSKSEFVTVTEKGEFIIFSGTAEKLLLSFYQELNDVDALETDNDFLLTSRAGRRVFFYNSEKKTQDAIPYPFEGPTDADQLPDGNFLVCDSRAGRVVELTRKGEVVWSYSEGLTQPMDALRLANGNTLITDFDNHRILEIRADGEIVSERADFDHPMKMSLLPTGNILVADGDNQRLLEYRIEGGQHVVFDRLNFISAAAFLPEQDLYICAITNRFAPEIRTIRPQKQRKESIGQRTSATTSITNKLQGIFVNRFALLVLALVLWAIRKPRVLVPAAYILAIAVAYRFQLLAASNPPYRPDLAFWLAAALLCLFSYRDVAQAYLPKDRWQIDGEKPRFPFTFRRLFLLLALSFIALMSQLYHMRIGFLGYRLPWYVPVAVWGIGLYLMLRPLITITKTPNPKRTIFQIGSITLALPFSFGTFEENSPAGSDETDEPGEQESPAREYWANTSVIVILVIAACLYIIRSTAFPTDVHGDSAEVALYGIQVRDSGQWAIFDPGWYQIPNFFFLIPAWVMWLFGDNLFGMRMADALIALGTIPIFYLLARRFFFPTTAAIATFLFATCSYVVHFSRVGIGYNQTTLLTVTALYFLVRGLQNADTKSFCLSGCVSGIGMLSYQASHILFPLIMATLGMLFLTRQLTLRNVVLYAFCFVIAYWVTVAPSAGNYLVSPEIAYSRANGVSIFAEQGRQLIHRDYPANISTSDMVRGQIERSVLGPVSHPDGSPYLINRGNGGVLDPIPAVLFVAGVFFLFLSIRNPSAQLLLFWTPITVLIANSLTNNAPAYQRLVGAVPLLVLIAAPVLYGIIHHISRSCRWPRRARAAALCAVLGILLVMGMHRYFHQIMSAPQMVDGWTRIARYLEDAGPTQYTYFFGPPYVYFNYGTVRFLAPEAKGEDINNPDGFLQRPIPRRGPVSFLLVHSNRRYIEELRRIYPGGKEESHYNGEGREPFISYEVNL